MATREPAEWNKAAADLLRQFLDTPTGGLLLAQLAFLRPALPAATDLNTCALQGQRVAGYESALNTLLSLAEPVNEAAAGTTETYPPLDDDSKWGTDATPDPK